MGQQLSCKYCSYKDSIDYCVRIEKVGDGGPPLDVSTHAILKEYQDLFKIEFDARTCSCVETYLCSVCFGEKFRSGPNWKKYSILIQKDRKLYFLSIFMIKKSSLWGWIEN